MLGLLNAIQNIGSLVGLPFAPYLSDGIGRRVTVLFGAGTMVCPPPDHAPVNKPIAEHTRILIGCRYCPPNRLPERWDVHRRSFPHRFWSHLCQQ